jgi:DNA topoisomerase IA
VPTEIGMVVTELLVKNFPYIFDTQYTAKLEASWTRSKMARRSGPIC